MYVPCRNFVRIALKTCGNIERHGFIHLAESDDLLVLYIGQPLEMKQYTGEQQGNHFVGFSCVFRGFTVPDRRIALHFFRTKRNGVILLDDLMLYRAFILLEPLMLYSVQLPKIELLVLYSVQLPK